MQAFFMKGEESYLDVHLLVVYEVLDIFMFFVQISGKLEMETWSALLLAHVDIYQHVVIRKMSTSGDFKYDNEFGSMLIGIITRNLFILWVKAHLDENELWVQLGDIVRDHDQVQCQYVYDFWYNTIINLSKCLLMKIFKCPDELVGPYPTYDVEKFFIEKKKGKTTKTSKKIGASIQEYLRNLDLNVVLYLFHKMLSLIGTDNTSASGKVYAKKLKVIHDVFNMFQQISNQEVKVMKGSMAAPFIHAPEGNKMIELMGYWIFDASERNDSAFAEGRLYAFKVLCRTFQTKFSQPWNKVYLANFLRAIHNGLSKGTNDVRDVVFIHSTEFFGLQLPGSNLLIPDFVKAAEHLYKSPKSSKEVKYAAISIMTAILSLCYFFGDVELPNIDTVQFEDELGDGKQSEDSKGASSSVDVSYHNFLQIKDRISKFLLSATSDESNEECQIHGMWGIFQLLFRELNPANPKVSEVRSHVDVIISCVLHKHSQLALTSHDVISSLSRHNLLTSIGYVVTNKLLSSISSAIIAHITDGQNLRAEILVSLYNTMADYIINAPNETITNPTVLDDVFTAIALGLNKEKISKAMPKSDSNMKMQKDGGTSKYADPSKDIYDSAYCLLQFILNYLNNFPNEIGPTTCSSQLSEFEFLREKNGYYIPNPNVLHYAFNGTTLFTIVEKVKSTRFIMRDMAGKNVWDFHLVFRPEEALFTFPEGKKKKKLQQDEEEDAMRERSGTVMLMKKLEIISDESKSKDTVVDGSDGTNTSLLSGNSVVAAAVDDHPIDEDATTIAVDGRDTTGTNDKLQDVQGTSEVTAEDTAKTVVIMGDADTDNVNEGEEYPIFNKDIDTDLTDMFKCLIDYSSDIFPECVNFRKGAVISLEQQNIDLKDVTEKIEAQSDSEKKILLENSIREMVKLMHPTIDKTEALAFKSFRNFMNTMGFCRQGVQINFLRLHPDWRFYKQLSILDKMPERETYKIGVIYVANGQEQAVDIFKTDQSSPLFKEFLEAIGWRIDLKSHYGYLGGLVTKECGFDTAPYYSDATVEVFYHVAPELVPKQKDPQNVFRRRIIGNDNVHIIWSEHDRDYRPWTVNSQCNYYHIVIYPMKNGLYRVHTFTNNNLPSIGPLSPGIILDKTSLGPMVRTTAINACRRVQVKLHGHKKAFMHRKAFLDDIISKYRSQKVEDYKDFLKPLFCQGTGTESEDVPDEPLEDPSLKLGKDKEEEYDPENEGSGKVLLKSEMSSSHLTDMEVIEF